MKNASYPGAVVADVIELRFAYSGRVVSVSKNAGDAVKRWQVVASLDRKMLQTELDRQLADYEKARASFELFRIKYGDGGDDTVKFLRQEAQAQLNASVKEVELAKFKMDQASLVSPVDGIILDTGGLVAGLNVTPSSNPVKIIDTASIRFVFRIGQEDLPVFAEPVKVSIAVDGTEKKYDATTMPPIFGKDGTFDMTATFTNPVGLILGMKGMLTITKKS